MASSRFPVAVIGMGVRLPGAENCQEFWDLMINGEDTVDEFPSERAAGVDHVLSSFRGQLVDEQKPFFTGSFFKSVDKFDPDVFQINPREAHFIEPEQRLFLETVWELLEDAGYASKIRGSNTGVYVGNTVNKYKYILNENHPSISHGNHSPFISSRVSYTHDLCGPAMMVATGCSSSLLAVHLACQGLLSGDCEMAIAGGITLDLLPISTKTDIWNQLGITAPHVKCRAFDASAKGIAKGEGCGVVLLKPFHKAVEDGDHIYGILEATTANQDGHSNGITAPQPVAQANMLHQAWRLAEIKPDMLGFFEAHGTGTELGDPIEISGITNAFRMSGIKSPLADNEKIPIGSVKANIGHLADGAAGIVGLIKALMCINKNKIPGAINFNKPNPHINWKKSPVYVNTSSLDWLPTGESPRLASVSAFGLLGTNIHAVVKEHKPKQGDKNLQTDDLSKPEILCFAANTSNSLLELTAKLLNYFKSCVNKSAMNLRDVCFTINTGREQLRFPYRITLLGKSWEEMTDSLLQVHRALLTKSFDTPSLHNLYFAVSVNGVDQCNRLQFSKNQSATDRMFVHDFLQGKKVSWVEFYLDSENRRIIPQLPTYAFDHIRLWPKTEKPINGELLELEHKCKNITDYHGSPDEHTAGISSSLKSVRNQVIDIKDLLKSSLNSALNTQHNWEEMEDEDLFVLGMDSLILTQVSMTLKDKLGVDLSMTEFRKDPSFTGLMTLIKQGINSDVSALAPITNITQSSPVIDVESLLKKALNEALGRDIDWKTYANENLFSLGVDSLIYTHVNMKLKESTELAFPIAMSELHENPTFYSLCSIITFKLKDYVKGIREKGPEEYQGREVKNPTSGYPISFAQRRLWVMQELATNPCAYNATNCLKLTEDFHPVAFTEAVNQILVKNDAFYTVIEDSPNGPIQKHDWNLQVEIMEEYLTHLGDGAETEAVRLYDEDYRTPFILSEGPLVRCKLYHLPNNTYYYTMVIHHIIFDGWSHFVFYNELWTAYNQITQGKQTDTILKRPFYTQIAEEEQKLTKESESRQVKDMGYWKKKLSGSLPVTTFPGDKKRPPVFTYNGDRITRFIDQSLLCKLERFSKNQHTMFMTLLSTVYSLLKIFTGENDFIIGTPIAGRYDSKSRDVIGCFINTLALRVQLADNLNFNEILEEVSVVCLEAYDHQQAAFDHLVSQINLPRDTSITPVFSINVCYHNTEIKGDHVNPPEEITVERKLLHNNSSKWDMQFDFLHESEGMRFTLEYYNDVFSDIYASHIVDNFIALLNCVAENPALPIEKLIPRDPKSGILDKNWQNSIMRGVTTDLGGNTLPELLLNSMSQNVGSTVTDETGQLSYEELLNNISSLSSFLRDTCRLEKGDRVGILMENSTQSLQAVATCLLSQLVYVPLDINSPKARLEHICMEAGLKAVLFESPYIKIANHLQWMCPTLHTVLCLDSEIFDNIKELEESPLMDTELWDSVAIHAETKIEGGGWKSSYTGENMTEKEMKEYSNNVFQKLKPFLNASRRVLEIGCASGLTTHIIKPNVQSYVATDLSQEMVNYMKNVYINDDSMETFCAPAHEVAELCKGKMFDIIIINSVIHCFPGHNYLRKVLRDCENLLSEDGIIFLGDLMDLDLRDRLVTSMKSFKDSHPEHRVKTDWTNELFISRRFLDHFCSSSNIVRSVKHSRKIYTVSNELTEFRFDSIFSKADTTNSTIHLNYQTFAYGDVKSGSSADSKKLRRCVEDISFEDEAYILYTSGTTGTPKGVVISQEALLNYTTWAARTYQFSTQTQTPYFAPLTFDFTVTSIFPPLLNGSNIQVFRNFQDSYQEIADSKELTIAKFSPMQLEMILSAATKTISIKTFILGGEELTSTLLNKLKQNQGSDHFEVWNEYGPTEATVGCIVRCFQSHDLPLPNSNLVTIGRPIDNVTVGVTRSNQLVPIGAKGYLAIGGRCLCSRFVGEGEVRKAKELKSFSNGLWGSPVDRMLLTEDVVEVLPSSGEMAYFGRKDDETTKVNGIRVDIGEVQNAIEKVHFVKSSWVCSFEFEDHTYLGAAIEINKKMPAKEAWKQAISEELKQHLPLRSIPKVIFAVTTPPTNRNGKKDLPYLKTQCCLDMQTSTQHRNPRTADQTSNSSILVKLQKIWHSILPINYLPDPNQNFFFDLSGDSLQAIHLVRKMRDEGFKVSVTDIFQNPTIKKLMTNLTLLDDQIFEEEEENIAFKPTPIVENFLLQEKKFPDYFALSALLDFKSKVDSKLLRKALRSVMKKHGSLRSKLYKEDGKVWQEVVPLKDDQPTIIEIDFESKADHLSNEEEFIDTCQKLDRSHSLKDGILVNGAIFNIKYSVDDTKCYGLLVVHHAALDIVSWQQIIEDLAAAFRTLSEDDESEPILKPCQLTFRAYCETLHAESSGIFAPEASYWADVEHQCQDAGLLVEKDVQSNFKTARWYSKSMEASSLRAIATGMGCSDEQVLLTAFGRSMSILHGNDKTALCMESHGRQLKVDSSDTVGWCTTMFPFILDTPLKEDIYRQVKRVGENLNSIPNHGLGFGLLKSAGEVSMTLPKVTFIFQGSLDASSKETLDGGKYKFDHIPWIEIMLNELRQRRFHRHTEEVLEFDLEFIAWIHSGELKFGCLFDEETISQNTVEEIVKRAEINLNTLAERAHHRSTNLNIEVIPGFTITPECKDVIKDALEHFDINTQGIKINSPEEFIQTLCQPPSPNTDLTVVIPRLTNEEDERELLRVWNQFQEKRNSKLIVIDAENLPNTHQLPALPKQTPVYRTSVCNSHYDTDADTEYNMPLSKDGYTFLGLHIARYVKATTQRMQFKVVTVDGDYTLWDGECAQGNVSLNQGNIDLQKYLLRLKRSGVLLVLLSKNEQNDVIDVFRHRPPNMIVNEEDFVCIKANWERKHRNIKQIAEYLNLGLDSFVFIDDNVLECEEMLRNEPTVMTLLFPGEASLVTAFLDSLWMLDNVAVSKESTTRTEMYNSEMSRKEELNRLKSDLVSENDTVDLTSVLRAWNMEITIVKSTIKEVMQHENILQRTSELLQRTNQFKLNDVHTDLSKLYEHNHIWIALLKDSRGSYGIVSVCILDNICGKDLQILQWVVSCRALNRQVENRLLSELYALHIDNLEIHVNTTKRNTPMINFLQSVSRDFEPSAKLRKQHIEIHPEVNSSLHRVVVGRIEDIENGVSQKTDNQLIPTSDVPKEHGLCYLLTKNIETHWTPLLHDQASRHKMFPLIPRPRHLKPSTPAGRTVEDSLVNSWMEVLNTTTLPDDKSNFHQQGGTSFTAVFLVSKLRQIHNINISIVDLLQNPEFGKFKNIVLNAKAITTGEHCQQEITSCEVQISAAQQRMIIMQECTPESTSYVETVVGSSDHPSDHKGTFQLLTTIHPILTCRIKPASYQKGYIMTHGNEININVTEEIVESENVVRYISDTIPVISVLSSPLAVFRYVSTGLRHFIVVHVHHIICDDVTLSSIKHTIDKGIEEIEVNGTGEHSSYQEYTLTEMDYHGSDQFEEDKAYWQKLYSTALPSSTLSNMPGQQEFSDSKTYLAKHRVIEIPKEALGKVPELQMTEFQYYLACSTIVLQQYFGTQEMALAIPVTTRSFKFQKTDGLFVNTVIPKFVIDSKLSLNRNIHNIANNWLLALRHSQYPLDELSGFLWKEHGRGFSSFCTTMFNFLRSAQNTEMKIRSKHTKMPLSIDFVDEITSNTLNICVEWASEIIPDNTVIRLTESIVELLTTATYNLQTPLYLSPTLSKSEMQVVTSFSESQIKTKIDKNPCNYSFEEHAKRYGEEIALICDSRTLTYKEVDDRANRIASGILKTVHSEELKTRPVVILMKKNEEAIVSILGVWKAGGHFLPVSLSNKSTIKDIYSRAKPLLVLTSDTTTNLEQGFTKSNCSVLSISEMERETCDTCAVKQSIDDLAYVIRTSGSSGTPKQCKITHRSLQTMSAAWKKVYKMTEYHVNLLQWAPLSFDVFVGDIARALVAVPGTLVICPDERRLDVNYIVNLIKDRNISIVELTPQFGQQIVENSSLGDLDSLEILILGSDVVKNQLFSKVKNCLQRKQRLINSYGMTEATVDSAYFEGDPPITRTGTVPIGKPLPGVQLHILNPKTQQRCPVGTIGELYICGDILASGDVDTIELDGTKALKTGDSACWLPTGDIELLGRLDNMMKLRGFRISTSEIENKIMATSPKIKSTCVMPMTNENDMEFLCAFVVLDGDDDGSVNKASVGYLLKADLPYYMIPDVVHVIEELPLTANGKVNLKALPTLTELFQSVTVDRRLKSDSNSSTIVTLKTLFAEAMSLPEADDVNVEQTFMEQGGHSLILLHFYSSIKQQTDYRLTIADIFSNPSISSLAKYIDGNHRVIEGSICDINVMTTCEPIDDIAITGVGMRLPGDISSMAELWKVLSTGKDLIKEFPASRKDDVLKCMNSSKAETMSQFDTFKASFLDSIDQFDHQFFKIAPGEAKFMSPEQRLFLEVATEALSEGRNMANISGSKVGVFVSNSEIGYAALDQPDEAISISGLMPGMIATRVAYQFDLKGPTMMVDTACSSSLMALKLACESIQKGECDGALVGGANIVLYPARTGVFGDTGILSPDFHCKTFDKDATGTAVGEGVMCIYVEPLETALRKGKPVYGVIKGVAANSVGHGNGITAPTSSSQKQVIESALTLAQLKPSDISFVETHGTGTKLGDRIELSALSSVFSNTTCIDTLPIGAVKSVFGHLDSVAGMIGVFKILASMIYKQIPPTAHFRNPHHELTESILTVPAETTSLPVQSNRPFIAGVSSFGLTGTNCHAIISQTTTQGNIEEKVGSIPLLLVGKDLKQIQNQIRRHITFIEETIVKAKASSITGLCVTVAKRILDMKQAKLGHTNVRFVLHLRTASQSIKTLKLVNSCQDIDDISKLADVRNDISSKPSRHVMDKGVHQFLSQGEINCETLFGSDYQDAQSTPGVYLEVFSPSRHWIDVSSSKPVAKVGLIEILEQKLSDAREMVRSLPLAASAELRELEGQFCVAVIIKLLLGTKLSTYLKDSSEVSFKAVFKETGMLPKYDKLFYVMIREMYENHVVRPTGQDKSIYCLDSFRFDCAHLLNTDPDSIAQYAMERYPAWSDCFRFPLYCSQYLTKVLWGKMSPLSVIYPQGDLNYMYQFNRLGDLIGDVYYNMYMQLIVAYAKQLSDRGKKVRILEVGAGMGHVTRQLIPKLKKVPNVEYWFTDLGKAFVENAKTLFEDYLQMMKFCTFDITKNAPRQGLLGSYDIVISYNVIHTTESVMDSVINLKSCLGEDGTLFVIESAKNETWATLAWGILDGWWYFKDYDLRPDEPMMEPEKWERVLRGAGFGSVQSCPVDQFERDQVEKFLFICSAKPLHGELQQLPGWWETINLKARRHHDLEKDLCLSRDSGVDESPVERRAIHKELKQIWCELFGIDDIKPNDEFNSLGGESLLAIQMMTMVRKRIGYQLEIADTFGYPSLGGLADFIADKLEELDETVGSLNSEQLSNISTLAGLSDVDETECISTMLMFPGQGSQKPRMCVSMKDSAEARSVFEIAEQILGYNILELFLEDGPDVQEKLKSTEFVQVALLVGCLAKIEQIKVENPEKLRNITHVSGLSVGEFAALVYCKVISFEDALKIVQIRGYAMENEVQRSATGMVSVFGPETEKLKDFLDKDFPLMKISTYLADNQHTLAGTESEVEEVVRVLSGEAKDQMDIVDVRKLRVAGGFHSQFMEKASELVDPVIEAIEFSEPSVPLIMNVTGEIVDDPVKIKSLLCKQLVYPVLWKQTVVTAYNSGVRNFLEVAPARVISSIVKNRISSIKNCTVELIVV